MNINNGESVKFMERPGADVLAITFGGFVFPEKQKQPPFSFQRTFEKYDCHLLMVRDLRLAWYQDGIRGVSINTEVCADRISRFTSALGVSKVVCFGSSMGGHGAILYGSLMGVDEVHAFSPQIFIDEKQAEAVGDGLLKYYRGGAYYNAENRPYKDKYYDLKNVINANDHKTSYHIYYSEKHRKDRLNAAHVADCPRVTLHGYPEGSHAISIELRDSGELDSIVKMAICHGEA